MRFICFCTSNHKRWIASPGWTAMQVFQAWCSVWDFESRRLRRFPTLWRGLWLRQQNISRWSWDNSAGERERDGWLHKERLYFLKSSLVQLDFKRSVHTNQSMSHLNPAVSSRAHSLVFCPDISASALFSDNNNNTHVLGN